ncbi:MAG: cytochrome c peroxidase [Phycisphaerales bacterium]
MPTPVAAIMCAVLAQGPLGNPTAPAANPVTEPKRLLGKILFWDEQLSSSNTVSCGTCHTPQAGGGDLRRARNPGSDGLFMSGDDVFGSPGLILADGQNNFSPEPAFAFASQVTARASNSAYMGAYSNLNFWDGRAGPSLVDPITGQTLIAGGAALEAQVLGPPVSNVEMAHFGRSWGDVVSKLGGAQPLALADQVPADVAAALADSPSYATLFERAFGTPQVTPGRVAMAIATYERTLVPNQTPWDRYVAGNTSALTPRQVQGMIAFNSDAAKCADCHGGNRFTDNAFHNIGVRPSSEDPGARACRASRAISASSAHPRSATRASARRSSTTVAQRRCARRSTSTPACPARSRSSPTTLIRACSTSRSQTTTPTRSSSSLPAASLIRASPEPCRPLTTRACG